MSNMHGDSQMPQLTSRRDRSPTVSLSSFTFRSAACVSAAGILVLLCITGASAVDGSCKKGESCSALPRSINENQNEVEENVRSSAARRLLSAVCMPADCYGHGTCTSGTCVCEEGWNSALNCSSPQDCTGLAGCSGHGICLVGGTCMCDPGWEGPLCASAACPRNCSGHGTCMNGVCNCDLMWDSDRACSSLGCSGNCSNHGVCVAGECECDEGWGGESCNSYVCQDDCSGHGQCDSSLQRCVCSPWYTGVDCSTALCPRDCSGHGVCAHGECICDMGYSDYDCSFMTCNAGCSGHGLCQPNGVCVCQTGFFGDSCNSTTPDGAAALCPMDCSGHGLCEAPNCVCDAGWTGGACELDSSSLITCPGNCSSHGVCQNSTCICDLNWEGDDCSLPVSCPNSCSSHGSCMNGTCVCDLGWQGMDCSMLDGAEFCGQNCTSGVGVYRNGTCDCDSSAAAVTTASCAGNCSGNGVCVDGTCVCDFGFSGISCLERALEQTSGSTLCANNCSMHGACVNGSCACDLGWSGVDCSASDTQSECPNNCNGRGTCFNSTCICDMGYSGLDCSIEALISPGCAGNCSGHGACFNETCLCDAGWHGDSCSSEVDIGATPIPGFTPVSTMLECENGCVHGTCITGVCFCDPFYTGPSCEERTLVVMMGCPNECSQHGTCVNGTCICDRSWAGVDCSQLNVCPGWSEVMGVNCSGNGQCTNGTCACDSGWSGLDCSSPACQADCSGHGICANGTCACDFGWRGGACSDISCPGDCSGHGTCSESLIHPVCSCDASWGGSDCNTRLCPSIDPSLSCSGNGACAQNGTCLCYENYIGDDCSILRDCNGRGSRKCGFCQCLEGFMGDLCETDVCEDSRIYHPQLPDDLSLSTVCSGHGVCTTEAGCVCQTGFAGKNCSQPAVCPTNSLGVPCSGHGSCYGTRDEPGICNCNNYTIANSPFSTRQYTGLICETLQCPGFLDPQQCSGRGTCTGGTCACFNVNNEGIYTGSDCGVPPRFYVSSVSPKVAPLEGGTQVTVIGPGMERLFGTFTQIYCSFGVDTAAVPAQIGFERDTLLCKAPAQTSARVVTVRLTDVGGTSLPDITSTVQFEYYVNTNVVRINPTFGPLRPTPVGAFNQITVTGSYFPFNGDYVCKFGDCESEPAVRIDAATITCRMPVLAKGLPQTITVSSNAQNFSEPKAVTFTAYEVTSVTPRCGSQEGLATATVRGRFLVDENDLTRNPNNFICRFGQGSIIFYSQAEISSRVDGAVECPVPNRNLELEDAFALSLDAFTEDDGATYDGRWDSTSSVTYDSYYPPDVGAIGGAKAIAPTVGPTVGGTKVTISGQGFAFSQYGPGNPFFADWEPKVPGCNPFPIPTCRFGTTVTTEVELVGHNTVVCTSPALSGAVDQTRTVTVEVALDGQSYTTGGQQFKFTPPGHVDSVFPSAGVASGGGTVTVLGTGFVDSTTGRQEDEFLAVLSCVFVATTDNSLRYISSATFVEPTRVTCPTPAVPTSLNYEVYISMSGQFEDDSQLGSSDAEYFYYADPRVETLEDPIGTIMGGEVVKLTGRNFFDIPGSMYCRFGPFAGPERDDAGVCQTAESGPCQNDFKIVEAIFEAATVINCPVNFFLSIPQTVKLEITLNGVDYTTDGRNYTFYNLVQVSPSSGPAHGGTNVTVKIDGGPGFRVPSTQDGVYKYRIAFGDLQPSVLGTPNLQENHISFRTVSYLGGDNGVPPSGVRVPIRLALTSQDNFRSFDSFDFIFYNVNFTSVGPCLVQPCPQLVLPKDGLNRTVTLHGFGLWNTDTITCSFFRLYSSHLDMNGNPRIEQNILDRYRSGKDHRITHPGMHEGEDNGGSGTMGCRAPPVVSGSNQVGYYVSVAPNGQNFHHEVFILMYLEQPDIHEVTGSMVDGCFESETGGLIDRPLSLQVRGSNWLLPNGSPPPFLSCLFFSPLQGQQIYSRLMHTTCSGDQCEGVCMTPTNFQIEDVFFDGVPDQLVKTQLFVSLNRRDPCMACGCNGAFAQPTQHPGYANELCIHEEEEDLYNKDSLISKFDETSQGFCSSEMPILADTSFCGIGVSSTTHPQYKKCSFLDVSDTGSKDDVVFTCTGNESHYAWHTFYAAPEILVVAPAAIGGEGSFNTTAAVSLAGNNLFLAWWVGWDEAWESSSLARIGPAVHIPVVVRATYFVHSGTDSQPENHTLLISDAAYDTATDTIELKLPTPCLNSSLAGVEPHKVESCFRIFPFSFAGESLEVNFEVSFNGGCQFTAASAPLFVFEGAGCPTSGCGHGTCIEGECQCGVWGFEGGSTCSITSQTAQHFTEPTLPFGEVFDYSPYSIYETTPWSSKACAFMGDSATSCGQGRENELSCSAGPILKDISPIVGIRSGDKNTKVTVTLLVFQNSNIRLADFAAYTRGLFVCYFGSCGLNSTLTCSNPDSLPTSDDASVSVECSCFAPHPDEPGMVPSNGMVDVVISQTNTKGDKSPANFAGTKSFMYFVPPRIIDVHTMGYEMSRQTPWPGVSVPICRNDESKCPANPFKLRANGTNFLPTATIKCKVGNVVTTGVYMSPKEVICNVPFQAGDNISAGTGHLQVSLDDQIYTDVAQSPDITFFIPPKVVKKGSLGFGVDPSFVGKQLESMFGENPGLATKVPLGEYSQLGPSSGGTPLVFYMKEPENTHPGVVDWSIRGTMRLRFGNCVSSCMGLPETDRRNCQWDPEMLLPPCTCDEGPTVTAYLNGTAGSDGGEQVYKLRADTPAVSRTGRYMMCFSANGVHYLPLVFGSQRTLESDRFYFRFYSPPVVSGMSITEAPLNLPSNNFYQVRLFGSNFLLRSEEGVDCKYVEVGLCSTFSPRIFIQLGGPGLVTKGVVENVSAPANVDGEPLTRRVGTFSSTVLSLIPPSDLSQPFDGPYAANISVSFNGYDFTPIMTGQTEIEFFRLPTVRFMSPRWGHMDFPSVITITGRNFDNLPGRAKCRISDCLFQEDRFTMVPATFYNETTMLCTTTPRLPFLEDPTKFERMNRLCIAFTPDGRESTRLDNKEVFDAMMLPIDEFKMSDDVRTVSTSSYASPIRGGAEFSLTIRDLIYRPQDEDGDPLTVQNPFCIKLDAANDGPIRSTVFAFVPTSATWATFRPAEYGDVIPAKILSHFTDEDYPLNFETASNDQPVCFMQVMLEMPVVPFPMTAELKVSFDGGQNFVGPSSTVLFYIDHPPQVVVPVRGSAISPRRPQLTVFMDPTILAGANPAISATQANALFSAETDCNSTEVACPRGPQCRFMYSNDPPVQSSPSINDVAAFYEHDSENPLLTCTLPTSPLSGNWEFLVSMDGYSFQRVLSPEYFLFYDQPCVRQVYPTNGLFDAGTELLVVGENFLKNPPGEDHQMWCIFDFQNLVPSADSWTVARTWSPAFAACDTNAVDDPACATRAKCRVPVIAEGDRPTIPALPRARVGIIVDGRCLDTDPVTGECRNLLNSDTVLASSGFFQYHNVPVITSVAPIASSPSGGLNITVTGQAFRDSYNIGHASDPPSCFGEESYGPAGFRAIQFERICNKSKSDAACHGLTCRFDQTVTQARLEGDKILCSVPPRSVAGIQIVNFSVSLNGETMEFSEPLPFAYALTEVTSILPAEGTAQGGGLVSVRGRNFIHIQQECLASLSVGDIGPCLQCRFLADNGQFVNVEGVFVDDELIICAVPAASDLGYNAQTSDGIVGVAHVTVSLNGAEYTPPVAMAKYTYTNPIVFTGFTPTAGSTEGNTTINILGNGFLEDIPVQCKFGTSVVGAVWQGNGWSCDSPARSQAEDGGVFMGFSTNNFDFCELLTPEGGAACEPAKGNCECIFTSGITTSQSGAPFYYHDPMSVTDINPPSGKSTGGTLVDIHGVGFAAYGQQLTVWFGTNLSVPATIVDSGMIRCYSPAMSNEIGPSGTRLYSLDVAVPIRVTSNNQQYTTEESGQVCEAATTENKYAYCDKDHPGVLFVMFSWFKMPIVDTVKGGSKISSFYQKLNPHLYPDLLTFPDIPQGPTSGGTVITVSGLDFTSPSRPYLAAGDVIGQSCTTRASAIVATGLPCPTVTCDFPFRYENELHYNCITLLRPGSQDEAPWCSIGGTPTFRTSFARCNYNNVPWMQDDREDGSWQDWRQNGKVVTKVQCKFGDLPLVDARVITNGTILCTTPPSEHGIVVPISVTLNGRDFTQIKRTGAAGTYFQYLKPSPVVQSATVAPTGVEVFLKFDVPTNIQGLQEPDRVIRNTGSGSGCRDLFSAPLIATLGQTVPTCSWNPAQDMLTVKLGSNADFSVQRDGQAGTTVTFNPRDCEMNLGVDACTNSRTASDLLVFPTVAKGCSFPSLDSCVQIDGTHPQWCGRCIPSGDRIPELSYSFNQSVVDVRIQAPAQVLLPEPTILGPRTVDDCTEACYCREPDTCGVHGGTATSLRTTCPGYWGPKLADLDGTSSVGQLGRPFRRVEWGLDTGASSDPSILQNVTKNMCPKTEGEVCDIGDLIAYIPSNADRSGSNDTYCFTLTLENWLGGVATNQECFLVQQWRGAARVPSVKIDSLSTFDHYRTDNLRLRASIVESACPGVSNLSYVWSISPSPATESADLSWSTVSKNGLSLYIGSNNLKDWIGQGPYTLTLKTRFTLSATVHSMVENSVVFTLKESKPVAVIAGNHRTVGSSRPLKLNGAPSYDPDRPGDRSKLKFCWTCLVDNETCTWDTFAAVPDEDHLEIPNAQLEHGVTYKVSLVVSKLSGSCSDIMQDLDNELTDSTTSHIYVESGSPPIAEIAAPQVSFVSDRADFVISGSVYAGDCVDTDFPTSGCAVDYMWMIDPPLIPEVVIRSTGFGTGRNGFGKVSLTIPRAPLGSSVMSFENVAYTISLVAMENGYEISSTFEIAKNLAPQGGEFSVSPTEGNALDTIFTLRCTGWVDEDTPLLYKFTSTVGSIATPVDVNYGIATSITTELPRGDAQNNFQITMHGLVQDNLGAEIQTSAVVVRVTLELQNATLFEMQEKKKVDNLLLLGDTSAAGKAVGAIGAVISSLLADGSATPGDLAPLFAYTERTTCKLFAPDPSLCSFRRRTTRRLLQQDFSIDTSATADALSNYIAAKSLYWDAGASGESVEALLSQSGLTAEDDLGVLDLLRLNVGNARPSAFKTGTGDEFLGAKVLAVVQNCHATSGVTNKGWKFIDDIIGYTSVSVMEPYTSESAQLSYEVRNDMGIAFKKIIADSSASPTPTQTINIPSTLFPPEVIIPRNMYTTNQEFTVDAVVLKTGTNPFSSQNPAALYGRIVSVNARPAIAADDQAGTISKGSFTGLSPEVQLNLRTTSSPPVSTDATTGVSQGGVCGFWNTSGVKWSQFDVNAEVLGRQDVPLTCRTTHLTEFSIVQGTVDCNGEASANPVIFNDCQVCGGGAREALAGICDWNATPCVAPRVLDKCKVCVTTAEREATESTKKFRSFALRNESGICNYLGNPCGQVMSSPAEQLWPTRCGVCDRKSNEALQTPSDGVCDCEAIPGGTQVVDRCNICGGNNISSQGVMDECGANGDIPAKDVCHAGGVDSRWNAACTGCDGLARPEKAWVWDNPACTDPANIACTGQGGARVDQCGICDGDGSTCAGCDNQGSVLDICNVCNGTNTTCVGCDGVPRARPYQIDGCGECKDPLDGFFGACNAATKDKCDYGSFSPPVLCRQDCRGGTAGLSFDRCGDCGGNNAPDCSNLGLTEKNWTSYTQCAFGVFTDACGKCGGDGSSCRGCSESTGVLGVSYSGLIPDQCGVCDGDDSSCIGCDGVVNSGKSKDLCDVCDGGNRDRDICGVCFGDNSECMGCDGKPFSGKAQDACAVCGGANLCKWRDGEPPPESNGGTDAVEQIVTLAQPSSSSPSRPAPASWLSSLLLPLLLALSLSLSRPLRP